VRKVVSSLDSLPCFTESTCYKCPSDDEILELIKAKIVADGNCSIEISSIFHLKN